MIRLAICCLTALSFVVTDVVEAQARWEADIRAFEAADAATPPEPGGVLFVGSSSIRMWTTLSEDFEGMNVLNRGFGGSQMTDVIHYAHRIVVPYAPRLIVLYEGDNDVAAGKSPEEVFRDYLRFVALARNQLPDSRIAFIAVKPSLARWNLAPEMQRVNRLVESHAANHAYLDYIDVWEPMLGENGEPMPDLFLDDGLHMNERGYAIWTEAVAPFVE
ncbi:MAG: SGNH/GDSL hydrolase family protein [Rhodothermales bacterium]